MDDDKLNDLLQQFADAQYDCGAWIKGLADEPFHDVVTRAMLADLELRTYLAELTGAKHEHA